MKSIVFPILLFISHLVIAQTQTGKASFYSDKFEGRQTASGEIYKHNLSTAAHRKLPFGTKVKVTNLQNDKTAVVKINDRGPFIRGRIIDLSQSVANYLGVLNDGNSEVNIEVIADQNTKIKTYNTSKSKTNNTVTNSPNQNRQTPIKTETTPENFKTKFQEKIASDEFFELQVKQVIPNFYGVQIASLEKSENLLKMANQLKASYNENTIVQVKTINGTKIFTVILGQFSQKQAAETFKNSIQNKYSGAFIVDMTLKD